MKHILLTGIYMAAFTMSNLAYGLGSDIQQTDMSDDAFTALQLTRCMVYTDLEKNMQTTLYSNPAQQIESFGIDDINSYAQKENTVVGQLSVED